MFSRLYGIISFFLRSQIHKGLVQLNQMFQFQSCNADIQHRWCEFIVKYCFKDGYDFLKKFLREHQAMGLYLYGEMTLSKSKTLKSMAFNLFQELKSEMDPSTSLNLYQMLKQNGNDTTT